MSANLTVKEAELLNDILEQWEEGLKDAKTAVQEDRSLFMLEHLLVASADLDEQQDLIDQIRRKVLSNATT